MKKAASKPSTPTSLGSKRQCPKCATKFYDFGKEEIVCPKCRTELDPASLSAPPPLKAHPEPKRSKVVDDEDAAPVGEASANSEEFESVEDLADDEDEIVDGVAGGEEAKSLTELIFLRFPYPWNPRRL